MAIRCGHCGSAHESVQDVRECSQQSTSAEQDVVQEPLHGPEWYLEQRRVRNEQWGAAKEVASGVWLAPEVPAQGGFGFGNTKPAGESDDSHNRVLTEPGFYAQGDDIYQTLQAKGTGRMYAKVLMETGWEYAKGVIFRLQWKDRLNIEQAKKYGKRTGRCLCCGRELTNPESIELGIGPICASRYF